MTTLLEKAFGKRLDSFDITFHKPWGGVTGAKYNHTGQTHKDEKRTFDRKDEYVSGKVVWKARDCADSQIISYTEIDLLKEDKDMYLNIDHHPNKTKYWHQTTPDLDQWADTVETPDINSKAFFKILPEKGDREWHGFVLLGLIMGKDKYKYMTNSYQYNWTRLFSKSDSNLTITPVDTIPVSDTSVAPKQKYPEQHPDPSPEPSPEPSPVPSPEPSPDPSSVPSVQPVARVIDTPGGKERPDLAPALETPEAHKGGKFHRNIKLKKTKRNKSKHPKIKRKGTKRKGTKRKGSKRKGSKRRGSKRKGSKRKGSKKRKSKNKKH